MQLSMSLRNLVKSGIFVLFSIYGIVAGVISVIFWLKGSDSILLLNAPPIWIGDAVYNLAIDYIGDPHSPHAHYTIPGHSESLKCTS